MRLANLFFQELFVLLGKYFLPPSLLGSVMLTFSPYIFFLTPTSQMKCDDGGSVVELRQFVVDGFTHLSKVLFRKGMY